MKIKHWILIALGIVGLLWISMGSAAWFFNKKGEVRIVNQSSQRVVAGEVEVCNQQFKIEDIRPGESQLILYEVKSDSHYKISVEFESGKKLTRELGYVTNGLDFKDTLLITDSDISLGR